jgi:hypothetical protein
VRVGVQGLISGLSSDLVSLDRRITNQQDALAQRTTHTDVRQATDAVRAFACMDVCMWTWGKFGGTKGSRVERTLREQVVLYWKQLRIIIILVSPQPVRLILSPPLSS